MLQTLIDVAIAFAVSTVKNEKSTAKLKAIVPILNKAIDELTKLRDQIVAKAKKPTAKKK